MLEIDIQKIKDIRGDKLFYYDDNGSISCIDLNSCAGYHEKSNGMKTYNGNRSVGERLFARPIAYYDLYSQESIRLYLELPQLNGINRFLSRTVGWCFDSKDFDLFYSVQKGLNENGWTTMDLS